jgi:hypothetical protein
MANPTKTPTLDIMVILPFDAYKAANDDSTCFHAQQCADPKSPIDAAKPR